MRLRPIALACGSVATAVLVRIAIQSQLGFEVPFLLYFPAVVVSSFIGGFGSGLLATGLSASAATAIAPGLDIRDPGESLQLSIFTAEGVAFAWIGRILAQSRATAAALSEQLRRALGHSRMVAWTSEPTSDRLTVVGDVADLYGVPQLTR